jgi:hypothetical protein
MFGPSRRSQTRPGPRSQGGDTGSNPVGTTNKNSQVRATVLRRRALNGDSNAKYSASIPHEVVRGECAKQRERAVDPRVLERIVPSRPARHIGPQLPDELSPRKGPSG